jgi:O-antigen ligase
VGSDYASLNISDLVLFAIGILFIFDIMLHKKGQIPIYFPRVVLWYIIVGVWIVISVTVAALRSPINILPNILWTIKWFEIFALLIMINFFTDDINWTKVIIFIILGSVPIASMSIIHTITATGWTQPTIFWNNPSTLGIFLSLPFLLSLILGGIQIQNNTRQGITYLSVALLFAVSVGSTGSRAALLSAVVGSSSALVLARKQLPIKILFVSGLTGSTMGVGLLWISGRVLLFKRYFPLSYQNGSFILEGIGSTGIEARLQLIAKGVNLWSEQPVFGYGWFASPENPLVGFLDNFYIQVLVDLGFIGFIFTIILYLLLLRAYISNKNKSSTVISVGAAGWLISLFDASIGGAHLRVPRIMYLLMILLVATAQINTYRPSLSN